MARDVGAEGCGNGKSDNTVNAAGTATVSAGGGGLAGAGTNAGGASSNAGSASSNAGNAGGNDGGSSGGNNIVLGNSLTEACIGYVMAVCERNATCAASNNAARSV